LTKEILYRNCKPNGPKGCKGYPDFVCLADNVLWFNRIGFDRGQYDFYEKGITDILNDGKRPKLSDLSIICLIECLVIQEHHQ
jgi:hypothetical protein